MSSSSYETPSSKSLSELTTMDESAATCLMLLSKVGEWSSHPPSPTIEKSFDCKTCGKVFPTFQALGGHRASHKKPKLDHTDESPTIPAKPRSHNCYICGAEFALGQALGGHMRRHKDSSILSNKQQRVRETTVLMRSNSNKRVCLKLDLDLSLGLGLNFTPPVKNDDDLVTMVESDLKLQLGKRDYEMKKSADLGRLQEYDLRMQMCKRQRFGDVLLGLAV